ncbi:uncharacterized protein LOC131335257 isoform X2 [Rhododendron vialii]|uniref:uncharacterized protein LOC131335257 isoform X2 n=1 Tax=Rhododendron vialii TaxID=182163 RepID=UPI00265E334D|nr:uncharacterized protein LOC131335257 isoform X2 [Rhododendron vialii]
MVKRRTTRRSPRPSTAELRSKLSTIFSRHEQMKVAFHHLKSQIKTGLLEAEDVFESLAIPLMRLVGLKTVEMAEEGRFSTIVTNTDSNTRGKWRNEIRLGKTQPCATDGGDEDHQIREVGVESYTTKATMASKELLQKQRLQLTQLVHLLRKIESQVNSSQDDILQNLADHQASIHKFFQRGIAYITAVHQTGQSNVTFLAALKLFKATFDRMDAALGSVERGIEDMMYQLAEQMCNPMVEYVKGLKAEMASGTCPHLLAIVEDMGGAMRNGKMELEEARKKVQIAEERNLEALCRLKESEERTRRMKEYLGYFLEAKKGSMEHKVPSQFLGMEEDRTKDERLLWELLKMKRKHKAPDSPIGPQELLCTGVMGLNNNHLKSTRVSPPVSSRPITRNYMRGISPQTLCSEYRLALGSSPTVATQQVLSRKRITP